MAIFYFLFFIFFIFFGCAMFLGVWLLLLLLLCVPPAGIYPLCSVVETPTGDG
jgi:hypothetical protein